MPVINQDDAVNHYCPFDGFKPCRGQRCMAWQAVGERQERMSTTNLVQTEHGRRPDEAMMPPRPEGDGWEPEGDPHYVGYENSKKDNLPKALEQWWVRKQKPTTGCCGRVFTGGMPF